MGSFAAFFYFGLQEINAGRIDVARFFLFLLFLLRSYDPLRKISRQYNELTKAMAAAKDVWSILDEDDRLPEKPGAVELTGLNDEIRIDHISFNYRNNKKAILQDITLDIPKGSVVALVGQSGGGKSSLTRLIQRLYDPSEGAIYWDGMDIRDVNAKSLRRQIALVTQETVLFNDTVRQNISYGKPNATDAEIREAAQVAYADEFIGQLPQGYDTMVGERGVLLSGGQRQRLAIARAVLMNAPVLILDEATSALDTESETMVQKALANLMKDRTSLVIAHRLSTVRKADRIVVMQNGRIIETGTHQQLLALGRTYKMLYGLQFAEADLEDEVII